jgi:hypothetical protein
MVAETYYVYYFGSWFGNGTHYLGVRFPIDGKMHYGWARLEVTWAITVTMTGFAYEIQPDTPIDAGQTGAYENAEPADVSPAHRSARNTLGALALGAGGLGVWRSSGAERK